MSPLPAAATDTVPAKGWPWAWLLAVAGLALLAVALRVRGILAPLWLDELWTLLLLEKVHGFLAVLTDLHHDNNHVLNSWYLLLWRGRPVADWVLRLPHLLAALGALWFGLWVLVRQARDWRISVIGLAILGANYLLVDIGSQARGYAFLLGPALACWALARRAWRPSDAAAAPGRDRPAWAYALLAIVGTLAQPLMLLQVLLPLGLWQLYLLARQRVAWPLAARQVLRWQLPAGLFGAWYYWHKLRVLEIGNQTDKATWEGLGVLRGVCANLLGLEAANPWALWLVAGLLAYLAWATWRYPTGDGAFWLLALVIPVAYIIATEPVVLATRYFTVPLQFLLWLLAWELWRQWQAGGWQRWLAGLLLVAYLAGQTVGLTQFVQWGRGDMPALLAQVRAATPPAPLPITIGGDHDFRDGLPVAYYAQFGQGPPVTYLPQTRWPATGPEWYLVHQTHDWPPPATLHLPLAAGTQASYHYTSASRSAPLSGYSWYLYRRQPPPP